MQQETESPAQHQKRSEFIRGLVQCRSDQYRIAAGYAHQAPKHIVQFWDDFGALPTDIEECVASWTRWQTSGFTHRLFDECAVKNFIDEALGARHLRAFARCYHPAMQSDYFRLCYLLVEGGCYVDADDVCVAADINWLFEDGRLRVQPLCYDIASDSMVKPPVFLAAGALDPSWIFYFNNNPLIACRGHPIISHALARATMLLEIADEGILPEIQATTGPGNLSKSIYDYFSASGIHYEGHMVVLRDWDCTAVSRWPLSHRDDARNWRRSNQKRFARRQAGSE